MISGSLFLPRRRRRHQNPTSGPGRQSLNINPPIGDDNHSAQHSTRHVGSSPTKEPRPTVPVSYDSFYCAYFFFPFVFPFPAHISRPRPPFLFINIRHSCTIDFETDQSSLPTVKMEKHHHGLLASTSPYPPTLLGNFSERLIITSLADTAYLPSAASLPQPTTPHL